MQEHVTNRINDNEQKLKLIDSVVVSELKFYFAIGTELKGWCVAIIGMDKEECEIQFGGITSDLMKT